MKCLFLVIITLAGSLLATPNLFASDESIESEKHLFYLHGGIVQAQGANAISPYWGRYEYTAILDTLKSYGFHVISKARPKETDEKEYAKTITGEINDLLESGVSAKNIIVVGASAGGGIAVDISINVKNSQVKYVVLGVCRWQEWKTYLQENELCGEFLSIYESSDSYGSCHDYFTDQECILVYDEIELTMHNGHGFLFRPYQEWVHPLVQWVNGQDVHSDGYSGKSKYDDSRLEPGVGQLHHDFELVSIDNDKVVINRATNLTWMQAGSDNEMTFAETGKFVTDLNIRRFAGYNDWRLPTVQEAFSLIEKQRNDYGLYIDPIFTPKQQWIWTGDQDTDSQVWLVNFLYGFRGSFHPEYTMYVRCVR